MRTNFYSYGVGRRPRRPRPIPRGNFVPLGMGGEYCCRHVSVENVGGGYRFSGELPHFPGVVGAPDSSSDEGKVEFDPRLTASGEAAVGLNSNNLRIHLKRPPGDFPCSD